MAGPRFAWGIDIGNRALKAIRLVRDGESFKIDDFEVIEHETILSQAGDNRDSLLQTALANFAQKHSIRGGTLAIGVSGQASFARFIKLPPVDPAKVADIVKFEAVQQIPFPLEEVEWSYQLFQTPESPEIEVGIFAMKRELVNQIIKNFTDVGLEVNAVQMNPLAVYNGLAYDKRIEGTTMIVDVGSENSDLIIADGESIWMRSIPIGGNNFTESLVKSFQLKFSKAEELKRNAATSKYGRQILQAMKPVFSDLVGEIQRSIGFYSSTHRESRIAKVLALGGTFRLPGLQKYLQQNLQLEVVRIDRLNAPMPTDARFAATFNENILSAISAYGLALQAMGLGKVTSSLLPEKIRRERTWREKTPWFAAAAALFVVGTGIAVGKLYVDRFALDDQTQKYKGRIDKVSSEATKLDQQWKALENSGSDDRKKITTFMTLLSDRDVAIKTTEELAKAFPPSGAPDLSKLRNTRRTVELVGWKTRYEADVTPFLTMPDEEFNKIPEKVELFPAPQTTGDLFNFHGTGVTGKSGAQRGFIVTLLCKTPVQEQEAVPVVSELVVNKLRSQALKPGEAGTISIERVTIPKKEKVDSAYAAGIVRPKKAPLIFNVPAANGAAQPPAPPPAPAAENAKEAAFADRTIAGEFVATDSLVTVLAVILIDPPVKPVPAGPAGSAEDRAPQDNGVPPGRRLNRNPISMKVTEWKP